MLFSAFERIALESMTLKCSITDRRCHMAHGPKKQSTGNYKGKRDRHEKPKASGPSSRGSTKNKCTSNRWNR